MPGLTITSANAVLLLGIDSVFPIPQKIEGFGVDDAFSVENASAAEVQLGVDGQSASGWTPRLTTMTITLLASSSSFQIFESWLAAMDLAREVLYANGTIELPSIGRKYFLPQGTLTQYPAMPNAKKVLEQRQFTIVWAWPISSSPI